MNEQEFTANIQRALNKGIENLPYKVTHRLEMARTKALSVPSPRSRFSIRSLGGGNIALGSELPFWRELLGFALPALVVSVALFAISQSRDVAEIDATAEIDRAVLLDELPISAYTDYGYGVFLKNSRQ